MLLLRAFARGTDGPVSVARAIRAFGDVFRDGVAAHESQLFWSAHGGPYGREQRQGLEGLIYGGWTHGRLVVFAAGNGHIVRTTY